MLGRREESLWHMIAAPTVWALHFCLCYGWTASVCARTDDVTAARVGIALVSAAALVAIAVIGWRAWRQWDYLDDFDYEHDRPTVEDRREFLGHAGWLLALVSGIGTLFVASPALFIESCL
ncbi:hypothetical protein ROJ8625_00341 [Roseivivax jejudonensis]|uniref:Transmembrane protein n=1 Tax=Roseivivax jejudonensis TaxID=1529041 RepID=A0A1X6Y6W2_9RHOB|nr:hypothetical protein [Roseivivax jejudonensis]SLN12662.1 hypothetical protein ROJ8625_00341 [Roseivivax jejudonensis]